MKFKELFNISVDTTIHFDLFTSKFVIPSSSLWQNMISLSALDEYLYNTMSDKVLGHRWNTDFIKKEFPVDDSLVNKVRQAYFNAIFKAHEYQLNGLAESMFYDYDPLVNYDRTETQTHNESVNTADHTTTTSIGARKQTDSASARNDSSSSKTTAFDSADYGKGTDKTDSTIGATTDTVNVDAATDTTTEAGYNDTSNGGYTLRAKGNIGVTTSQQMLESERQVRQFNFFEKVAEVLAAEMLVADWETEKEVYTETSSGGGSTIDAYTKAEVDALLAVKANIVSVYTKEETDELLEDKADIEDVYTRDQMDELLDEKADTSDVYNKEETYSRAEVNTLLNGKASVNNVYTKAESDAIISGKADASAVYTKAETVTLLQSKQNVLTAGSGIVIENDTIRSTVEVPEEDVAAAVEAYVEEHHGDFATHADFDNLKEDITHQEQRITNLENASKGVLYDTVTDSDEAYVKSIQSGAVSGYGMLDSVGGKALVQSNQIVDVTVDKAICQGLNLIDISEFARLYPDYCSYSNNELTAIATNELFNTGISVNISAPYTVSFDIKVISATNVRVSFVSTDGTTRKIGYTSSTEYVHFSNVITNNLSKIVFDWSTKGTFVLKNFIINDGSTEKTYRPYFSTEITLPTTTLKGINSSVYDIADFENKRVVRKVGSRAYQTGDESNPNYLTDMTTTYYPLATPTEETLSTDEIIIPIEPNGSITFNNAYGVAVPNSITYNIHTTS